MDRGKYVMSVRNLILSIIDQSKELKYLELELSKTNNLGKRNSLIKSKVAVSFSPKERCTYSAILGFCASMLLSVR